MPDRRAMDLTPLERRIEEWRNSGDEEIRSLHEYLGWSWERYKAWVDCKVDDEGEPAMSGVSPSLVPEREKELRRILPALHVGRWRRSRWHVLSAATGEPLCMPFYPGVVDEEDALEHVSPGLLCQHCARIQGNGYAQW